MSATPMRAHTVLISGNECSSSRSTSSSRLMVSLSELPGLRNVCMAMSPSSSEGMNSPPMRLNTTPEAASSTEATTIEGTLWRIVKRSAGW